MFGLLGRSFAPEFLDENEAYSPKKRWHRVLQLIKQFWKRSKIESLPRKITKNKWLYPKHNLNCGDVVMIVKLNAKRGEWPLSCVLEANPGKDRLLRVVKVKPINLKPVQLICLLEYEQDD